MFTDSYHPQGWERLFKALGKPCECEQGITCDHNGKEIIECRDNPLPSPGYRWYQDELRHLRALTHLRAA